MAQFNSICTHCGTACKDGHRDALMVVLKGFTYIVVVGLGISGLISSSIATQLAGISGIFVAFVAHRAFTNYDRCPACHALALIPIYSPTGRSLWDKHQAWQVQVTAEAEAKAKAQADGKP